MAKNLSSGATTTTVWVRRGTASKAARVCKTMGWPASDWYCLGPEAPEREPVPAQGIRAQNPDRDGGIGVGRCGQSGPILKSPAVSAAKHPLP